MQKPSIVILLSRFPFPLEKGDKLRAYHQIKELSNYFSIHLLALTETTIEEKNIAELAPFCKEICTYLLPKTNKYVQSIVSFCKKEPLQVGYFFHRKTKKKIENKIREIQPKIIYCQLIRTAKYVRDLPNSKVLDFQDAFSSNYKRAVDSSNFFLQKIYTYESKAVLNYENKMLSCFDYCTIISETDKKLINADKPIVVVKNGVDTDYFQAKNTLPTYDIVFTGNLSYQPNIAAVQFLVQKIVPLLLTKNPSIKILIAGANPSQTLLQMANNNVKIIGNIPDIREAYSDAKIFVAPLFAGAGMQNKLLEAMSMQLPCITTTLANNAIQGTPNQEIIIANTATEFAEKIEYLLANTDLQKQIGMEARQKLVQHYSWQSATKPLYTLLINLLS